MLTRNPGRSNKLQSTHPSNPAHSGHLPAACSRKPSTQWLVANRMLTAPTECLVAILAIGRCSAAAMLDLGWINSSGPTQTHSLTHSPGPTQTYSLSNSSGPTQTYSLSNSSGPTQIQCVHNTAGLGRHIMIAHGQCAHSTAWLGRHNTITQGQCPHSTAWSRKQHHGAGGQR